MRLDELHRNAESLEDNVSGLASIFDHDLGAEQGVSLAPELPSEEGVIFLSNWVRWLQVDREAAMDRWRGEFRRARGYRERLEELEAQV